MDDFLFTVDRFREMSANALSWDTAVESVTPIDERLHRGNQSILRSGSGRLPLGRLPARADDPAGACAGFRAHRRPLHGRRLRPRRMGQLSTRSRQCHADLDQTARCRELPGDRARSPRGAQHPLAVDGAIAIAPAPGDVHGGLVQVPPPPPHRDHLRWGPRMTMSQSAADSGARTSLDRHPESGRRPRAVQGHASYAQCNRRFSVLSFEGPMTRSRCNRPTTIPGAISMSLANAITAVREKSPTSAKAE